MIPIEQIEMAKRADLPRVLKDMGIELVPNGRGYHLKEHDSLKLFQQDGIWGYIRISQTLNMLNIKPVKRFIRISNTRNSVNFCSIFPCAKDYHETRRKINLRSDELNGGPFSRRLIFC